MLARVAVWETSGALQYEQAIVNQHGQPSGVTAMAVISDGEPRAPRASYAS